MEKTMKKHIVSMLLGIAALSALSAQTQAALTPEAFLGGHGGAVSSAVFSPDGRRVVTASWDTTVKLWNAETGQAIRTLTGHSRGVVSVAFSSDERRIATGSDDKTVRIWNAESGQVIRTLTGYSRGVTSVAFSPDGRRIASASPDKTVIRDAGNGREIRTLTGHDGTVWSVGYSPDGRRIATGSDDKTVRIWDVETGQAIRTLTGHGETVRSVAFSSDGRRIATGSDDKTVRIWDVETGQAIRTLTGHGGPVSSVAYSPDGRRIASASVDKTVRIWDAETGREIRTLTGHGLLVHSVAFSADGRRILSGSRDTTAKLWDVETGRELTSYPGIPAPLTRELLADYLNAAGVNAKTTGPLAGAALYKATPKETALQFGLLVYKAMQESRFLANTAAAGKYEEILRAITGRGNVTRAEIEAYYRQGIAGLVAEVVDEEFNKISIHIQRHPSSYGAVLTRTATNQYVLSYEGYFNGTKSTKELTAQTLDALLSAMSRSGDFTPSSVELVRTQAALIPAAVYADWKRRGVAQGTDALALVKETITNFYLNPNRNTYNMVRGIYSRYFLMATVSNDHFASIASGAYISTLDNLNQILSRKIVSENKTEMASALNNDRRYDIFSTRYAVSGERE
jgi:hypothetical protein